MSKKKLAVIIGSIVGGILLLCLLSFGLYKYFTTTIKPGMRGMATRTVLIAYSANDKGINTIADNIQSKIGGTLYPVKDSSSAKVDTRKFKLIFVGSPAKDLSIDTQMEAFLKFNKLDRKVVIPFMTYKNRDDVVTARKFKRYNPKAYNKNPFVFDEASIRYVDVNVSMWLNFMPFTRWEWR